MFRKHTRAQSPGIELRDMQRWSGDRAGLPRTGYTPPQTFPLNSNTQDNSNPNPTANVYSPRSPIGSALTSEDVQCPDNPPNGSDQNASSSEPSTAEAVDVITAQIHRALGPHDGTSDIFDDDTLPDVSEVDDQNDSSVWHAQSHEELFRSCIGAETVDVDELRRIVWAYGIPERPWARALGWKLLVGYLPPDRADWDSELSIRRAHYWQLVSELTTNPGTKATSDDHPLCNGPGSQWFEHFQDMELRAAIARDVNRTHPKIHRFAVLREGMQRILFVYAKRNASLRYRQGMNEILSPFMLVFADAPFEDLSDAEADAYFCFESIMQEMYTCYTVNETANSGISKQLRELQALLRIKDPRLEKHLSTCGVKARFFALRWIRLWLCQEFELPKCLRIWDSFLTAELTLPWLRYVCVAMVIRIRDALLAADFAGCMKLLLHYPPCDVSELLRTADRLRTSNVVIVRSVKR